MVLQFGERSARRRRGRERLTRRQNPLWVEQLESRDVPTVMYPFYHPLSPPGGGIHPFGSPAATGYTPSQIRHAYGFDQISFNGPSGPVAGDGTGTTIAIV